MDTAAAARAVGVPAAPSLAAPTPSDESDGAALAEARRRYARTGDDSALVAMGVLPVGKPVVW